MTLFAFPGRARAPFFSSAASRLGRLNAPPSSDRAPALSVSRRVSPSHSRRLLPSMVIIAKPSRKNVAASFPTCRSVSRQVRQLAATFPSVSEQELVGVEQRPEHGFPGLASGPGLPHKVQGRLHLLGQRRTRQGRQEQLV